jgi:hypothetical protein
MKCQDIRCRHCGKNSMETKTYLRSDGQDELGEPRWRCARPCQDPSTDTTLPEDERLLAAIEGRWG